MEKKKSAFICLSQESLQDLVQIALAGLDQLEVFVEEDPQNLITSMSFADSVDLLILDDTTLSKINETYFEEVPYRILFSNDEKENWECYENSNWAQACHHFIDIACQNNNKTQYAKIPFKILKSLDQPVCDIFLEITKEGNPHYIKLFNSFEDIDQSVVEKYLDKGVTTGVVLEEYKDQLLNSLSNKLYDKLINSPSEQIIGQALDTSLSLLKEIGFNSTTTQLIDGVIENINRSLAGKQFDDLKLIKDLLTSQSSRYYKKSHMTALLGCRVIQMAEWGTHLHQEMFSFLSLMADICLDKEEMLFITSREQLDSTSLTTNEKDKVWTHARDSYHLLQEYQDKPLDVDLLILEHHGNKNGVGFNNQLSPQLHKLTLIYRICEDFTIELLKLHEMEAQVKLIDIFENLASRHDKKSLHLIIDDLKKCFFS